MRPPTAYFAGQAVPKPGVVARHPITAFFVLAFALSWILWSPWWLGLDGLGLFPIAGSIPVVAVVNPLGILGPAVAALIVVSATEGRAGLRTFWSTVTSIRCGLLWWGAALLGLPLLLLLGALLLPGTQTSFSTDGLADVLMIYPLQLIGIVFLGGGLEEIGWRGFAQTRLQEKCSPLMAALLIGVVWAAWHAPLFLTSVWDTPRSNGFQVFLYVMVVLGLSIILAWIRNGSGSTLAAVVAHASVNGSLGVLVIVFPGSLVETTNWWGLGILLAATGLALVTRGRLGQRSASVEGPVTRS